MMPDRQILTNISWGFSPYSDGPNPSSRAKSAPAADLKLRETLTRSSECNGGDGMRVAVIGTGIAANAAAWTLSKLYPVTVYDRELRPGGHSHTVTIDYDGTRLDVDVGFIVYVAAGAALPSSPPRRSARKS